MQRTRNETLVSRCQTWSQRRDEEWGRPLGAAALVRGRGGGRSSGLAEQYIPDRLLFLELTRVLRVGDNIGSRAVGVNRQQEFTVGIGPPGDGRLIPDGSELEGHVVIAVGADRDLMVRLIAFPELIYGLARPMTGGVQQP